MKNLFSIFVFCILSSTAFAELVCLAPAGCQLDLKTGACPDCVEVNETRFNDVGFSKLKSAPMLCENKKIECSKRNPNKHYCEVVFNECVVSYCDEDCMNEKLQKMERNRG